MLWYIIQAYRYTVLGSVTSAIKCRATHIIIVCSDHIYRFDPAALVTRTSDGATSDGVI